MRSEFPQTIPYSLRLPWVVEDNGKPLETELKRELRTDGTLYEKEIKAIARRIDCDDVLFIVDDPINSLAVVHLTWSGKTDPNKGWPYTTLYRNWEAWKTECMVPDAEDYAD
jgi:hypothetical protein